MSFLIVTGLVLTGLGGFVGGVVVSGVGAYFVFRTAGPHPRGRAS
jgi:hypothetical protein